MEPTRKAPERDRLRYSFGATLTIVTGLVVLTVGLSVIIALFGGLWLDRQLGTGSIFTILLIVAAGPVSLYVVYRATKATISRMKPILPVQPGQGRKQTDEEGEDE